MLNVICPRAGRQTLGRVGKFRMGGLLECLKYLLNVLFAAFEKCIHLAGECPEVFVFIHRGMPRRTMLVEDDRDEGPRHQVAWERSIKLV